MAGETPKKGGGGFGRFFFWGGGPPRHLARASCEKKCIASPRVSVVASGEQREKGWGGLNLLVNLRPGLFKLFRFFLHAGLEGFLFFEGFFRGVFAHILRHFHAAEMRAAHGAEVRDLGGVLGERLVVERERRHGVEG